MRAHSNNGLRVCVRARGVAVRFEKQDNSCYVLHGRGIRDDAFDREAAHVCASHALLSSALYLLYFLKGSKERVNRETVG